MSIASKGCVGLRCWGERSLIALEYGEDNSLKFIGDLDWEFKVSQVKWGGVKGGEMLISELNRNPLTGEEYYMKQR